MNRRNYFLTIGSAVAIAGCSGQSDEDSSQEEGIDEGEQEETEQESENEQENTSQDTADLTGFNPDPSGYPNTTLFNEIHTDDYSIYKSPVTGNDFIGGGSEVFSKINHNLGIKYAITRSNGVLEVFSSIKSAEKRIELIKQAFDGSDLSIEGWGDWHLVENLQEWDQVLDYDGESDRRYPLLIEAIDESKRSVVTQVNNVILAVGIVSDEFSDPNSVLIDSIESRSNEYGSAGVPEGLVELGYRYSKSDIDYSKPDPDEVTTRDYFSVPFDEFSKNNVREIMTNRIATHGRSYNDINIDTETGNYGKRDISTSFSTTTPYSVGSPQFSAIGDPFDRFPGPWSSNDELEFRVDIIYNVYDTVETAVSEYQNWIDYTVNELRFHNEGKVSLIITTESGYDEQGFYVDEFIGTLRNKDAQPRLTRGGYLSRRTYLSGNAIVRISHMINNFDYA